MNDVIGNKLDDYVDRAGEIERSSDFAAWHDRMRVFLRQVFGDEVASEFARATPNLANLSAGIGFLEGLLARAGDPPPDKGDLHSSGMDATAPSKEQPPATSCARSNRVFVVHGHDVAAKECVARFVDKLSLTSVILHEQPNLGQTLIEKFEAFSDVGFAVVLLTPDDIAHAVGAPKVKRKRARQNVVLELGYFLGRLGRNRVCALYVDDVEVPSDYQGVAYIKLDEEGAWRTKLAQEFVQAGMPIDLKGLL
jgi:predicted nucleotide-binding protein